MVYSVRLDRTAEAPKPEVSDPITRAKQLTKPFGADVALESWAAGLIAAADDFQQSKRTDPLGAFLVTHLR